MPLPTFLIIGAQKCGTSTLSNDLNTCPSVFIPPSKEVSALRSDFVLSPRGRRVYSSYYRLADATQICGDASTVYSKAPDFEGVPRRASELLGNRIKIIYIIRDPVERMISHYKHAYATEKEPPDINEAIISQRRFLNYSRYAMQLERWLTYFPPDNIVVVHFESYINDRLKKLEKLANFLGVPGDAACDLGPVINRAEDRRSMPDWLKTFSKSDFYKAHLKPNLPRPLLENIKRIITKPSRLPRSELNDEVREWLKTELEPDQRSLSKLLGQDFMSWEADTWQGGGILHPGGAQGTSFSGGQTIFIDGH